MHSIIVFLPSDTQSTDRHWDRNKRNDYHEPFLDTLNQHASQFNNKQMFFEQLYELFDINGKYMKAPLIINPFVPYELNN